MSVFGLLYFLVYNSTRLRTNKRITSLLVIPSDQDELLIFF